ncbi:MAG TPA: proton-conducting transporter membrane subunit, partial [Myxococcales bacterium]
MHLAPWTVAVPLFCAALVVALGEKLPRLAADLVALAAAAATAALSALLLREARGGPVIYWFGGIRPRSGVSLGIDFAVDRMGAGLATLGAVLVFCALLFSARYFDKPQAAFQGLLLAFLAGLCGFSLTGDLFDLFVFFELMRTAAFGLCAYKSREVGPLQGAINFATTNTAGAFLTLTGIALLYARAGALNLAQMARMLSGQRDALVLVAFALVCTGFLVKAAVVPFHFWLADAHASAPTPACIIFSGAMVQAGLYAVARLNGALFATPLAGVRPALLVLGVATCLVGAALCYAQRHLKRLLAFSTVSHSGAILCGVALLDPGAYAGAGLYVVGHGCVKASLFLCAGMLLHRLHSVDELALHGRGRALPWLGALFALGGVLLAGAPPTALFLGESVLDHALRDSALRGHHAARAALTLSSVVTAAAVLRACGRIFLGWGPREPDAPGGGEPDEEPETRPGTIPWTMWAPALLLVALAFASFSLSPEAAGRDAARMLDPHAVAAQVLDGAKALQPAPPPPEPLGPGLWHSAGTVLAAVALAALTLGRKRLPVAVRRAVAALWSPAARALRALHTGEVGDQVAWLTFGVALLCGA